VLSAVVAMVPGFIDWTTGIPAGTRARTLGRSHMLLNLGAFALFTINLVVQTQRWFDLVHAVRAMTELRMPSCTMALCLSGLGVALTAAAGVLGYTLVQTYHVDVQPSSQERRRAEAAPRGQS
jgi:uncharacterized membrane protein